MRKGKLFTGKAWKRMVRILSCIVVFCTTYALILPAITQEAQAYCGNLEHEHTKECYKEILSCTREEHVHSEECFDTDGNLTCTLEEHTHSSDCYRELLECTEEEHTHSLECFSDADADLETEEDWKKTLPDEKALKDKTDAEKVLMIAESQKGCKESEKNYIVENEIEKKGITRYGQWDEDPYEDWAGAYARFDLHYAGIETVDAKKHTSDWLEQLHDKGELKAAEEAEAGDVLFVYDEKDQLKAGIVGEVKDGTVKAWMGDWDNQVQEKTFSKTDEKVHSVWKAIQLEEPADPVQPEGPADPEVPAEEEQKPEEGPKPDEEKPAEQPKDEEPVVSYNFTQEVEAEDGAKIKVSWNAGTFETEDVVFQAKKVELTEEEQKKVQEQLDKDKNYTFRNYDLTFYVRNESMELVKVEPLQPVHVEIEFGNEETIDSDKVFHFADDGTVETVEQTKEKLNADAEKTVRFKGESFSVYTVAKALQNGTPVSIYSYQDLVDYANGTKSISGSQYIQLANNLSSPSNWSKKTVTVSRNLTVDLNGHYIEVTDGTAVFDIESNKNLVVTNTKTLTEEEVDGNTGINESGWDKGNNSVYFNTSVNKRKKVVDAGVLYTSGSNDSTIKVNPGSTLTLKDVIIPGNKGNNAIYVNNGSITAENAYLVNGHRGIFATNNSTVAIHDGYIAGNSISGTPAAVPRHGSWSGSAIYVGPENPDGDGVAGYGKQGTVSLNDGAAIINNSVNAGADYRIYGGAVLLRGADLEVHKATISNNSISGGWVGGGGIAGCCTNINYKEEQVNGQTEGIEWTWGTPSSIKLYDGAVIRSNTSSSGGGGIFLQGPKIATWQNPVPTKTYDESSKLFMYGGTIDGNIAQANEGGGIHQAATYSSYAYLFAGTIANNRTNTAVHWGGGGAFVGESSYMMLPNGASVYSNDATGLGGGIAACSTGNIIFDEKVVIAQNTSQATHWTGDGTSKPYDRDYAKDKEGFKNSGDARDFFSCLYASVSAQLPGNLGGANWSGSVDYNLVSNINNGTLTANQLMGLTNNSALDKQNAALSISPLKIYDNQSNIHGGGILVNGYLVGGEVEFLPSGPTISFQANKQLQDKDGKPISLGTNKFEFELLENDRVIATGTNDADGLVKLAPPIVYMPVIDPTTVSNGKVIETTASYILKEKPNPGSSYQMSTEEYKVFIGFKTTLQYVLTYPVFNEDGIKIKDVSVYRADTAVEQDSLTVTRKSDGAVLADFTFTPIEGVGSMDNWSLALSPGYDPDFINKELPKKTLTVRKVWQDFSGNVSAAPERVSVVFKLLRRETGSEGDYETTDQSVTLPHDDKWEYTFENLDAKYDYKIQEVFDNPLYESTSAVTIGTSSRNVWVKAKSISDGQSYLIGSKDSNGKIVLLKGTASAQSGRVNASDKVTLDQTGETVQIGDDVFAESFEYTPEEDLLFTADTSFPFNQRSGTVLCSSNRTYTRAEEWGGGNMSGLMLSDSNGMKQEGGHLQIDSNGQISQKRRNTDTEFKKYLYDTGNNWFSSETNISSGNSVYLYEQKSITSEDPTHSIWTFTNKRKSSYQIKLLKIDGETKAPLTGVEFELYEDSNCTRNLKFRYDSGTYQLSPDGQITILRTDKDGNIALSGFAAGTYYLKESLAIDGYAPIEVKPIVVSETTDSADETLDMVVNATVENFKAYELPETGSAGTKIYTAAGTILLITGTGLYRYKRRGKRKGGETH